MYVCTHVTMYVWLCMYGYQCMTISVWLCMYEICLLSTTTLPVNFSKKQRYIKTQEPFAVSCQWDRFLSMFRTRHYFTFSLFKTTRILYQWGSNFSIHYVNHDFISQLIFLVHSIMLSFSLDQVTQRRSKKFETGYPPIFSSKCT